MSSEGSYYVPEQSKLPLAAATGMGVMGYGAASWVIDGGTSTIFLIGSLIMAVVMYRWWSLVIDNTVADSLGDERSLRECSASPSKFSKTWLVFLSHIPLLTLEFL
jgi:hypothetical protein